MSPCRRLIDGWVEPREAERDTRGTLGRVLGRQRVTGLRHGRGCVQLGRTVTVHLVVGSSS